MTEFDRTRDTLVVELASEVNQLVFDLSEHIVIRDDPEVIGELTNAIKRGISDMITVGSIRSPAHRRD